MFTNTKISLDRIIIYNTSIFWFIIITIFKWKLTIIQIKRRDTKFSKEIFNMI